MLRSGCWALSLVAMAFFGAGVALASDGAIEINAVNVAAGGVTPGDAGGFPVTISQSGSYRLTSNLSYGDPDTNGIEISAADVTLDLGGFAISSCGVPCGPGAGIGIASSADGTTVKNGRVSGMGADGISLQSRARVEDVDVAANLGSGISAVQGALRRVSATQNLGYGVILGAGLLEDSELSGNAGQGANLGNAVGFARNVFAANGLSVSGGHATGGNVCSDKVCSVTGARRFYLSKTAAANGAEAGAACAPGFHVASIWEIRDPSALFYDVVNGRTSIGSGQGMPAQLSGLAANDNVGWVMTGIDDAGTPNEMANCHGYTLGTSGPRGTILRVNASLATASPQVPPWTVNSAGCHEAWKVWCVED